MICLNTWRRGTYSRLNLGYDGEWSNCRYSGGSYSVWYYTDSTPHLDHDVLITSSLTRSPTSKIKCKTFHQIVVHILSLSLSLSLCLAVHSPSHQLQQLRMIKSSSELSLMRTAAEISCQAFTKVEKEGAIFMRESE